MNRTANSEYIMYNRNILRQENKIVLYSNMGWTATQSVYMNFTKTISSVKIYAKKTSTKWKQRDKWENKNSGPWASTNVCNPLRNLVKDIEGCKLQPHFVNCFLWRCLGFFPQWEGYIKCICDIECHEIKIVLLESYYSVLWT